MCRPTRCRTCGKTTWSGCGAHVAQVRASVPADQWCPGHEDANGGGWIRRLLTR
ncbi:hypothetical protein ACFYUD_30075 [Nocardia tengchongensis]|uniref:hypothetical protein n=1 Tax=Nocardia tengchongensis TaxID=2055889 RepID=UPI0033D57B30